jgi:hypothetical protein
MTELECAARIAAAVAAENEACAKIVEAECARVLACQSGNADATSFDASVDLNLRMTTVLLPEIAAAIRARRDRAAQREPLGDTKRGT